MNGAFRRVAAGLTNVQIALAALRINTTRSFLTTLGVMIGVLAVILAVAVGNGARVSVMKSINALGSNMAIVVPQPDRRGGQRTGERGRLTERDARAVARLVPGVRAVAPQLRSAARITVSGGRADSTAIGISPDYSRVTGVEVEAGRFIIDADLRAAAQVAVLGPSVATRLFGEFSPIGQRIRINRVPFKVVGLLEGKGSTFGTDNDDLVLVPLSTARQRLPPAGAATQGPDDLQVLFVGMDDDADLGESKRNIAQVLRDRNKVGRNEINPFSISTTEEFVEQSNTITSVLQGVLVAIASISLLVGGIGIMNIMLVSVTERTREIGLRMALGARRRDIRNQFLVEAAVLCVVGGAIGLALALGVAPLFERIADFPVPIGWDTALGAILFSALIGLAFGTYPAIRASRLSPIEALRSE